MNFGNPVAIGWFRIKLSEDFFTGLSYLNHPINVLAQTLAENAKTFAYISEQVDDYCCIYGNGYFGSTRTLGKIKVENELTVNIVLDHEMVNNFEKIRKKPYHEGDAYVCHGYLDGTKTFVRIYHDEHGFFILDTNLQRGIEQILKSKP